MSSLSHALQLLSFAATGVFTGAMLTEAFVLVPWWRSIAASEFLAWYAANDRRLLGYFGPVTGMTALISVAAAGVGLWEGASGAASSAASAGLQLVTVVMFPVYFEKANRSFSAASIPEKDLGAELARWAAWHAARTALSVLALALALLAVARAG